MNLGKEDCTTEALLADRTAEKELLAQEIAREEEEMRQLKRKKRWSRKVGRESQSVEEKISGKAKEKATDESKIIALEAKVKTLANDLEEIVVLSPDLKEKQ